MKDVKIYNQFNENGSLCIIFLFFERRTIMAGFDAGCKNAQGTNQNNILEISSQKKVPIGKKNLKKTMLYNKLCFLILKNIRKYVWYFLLQPLTCTRSHSIAV